MELVLTKGFSPGFPKLLKLGKMNLMETDFSAVVGEAQPSIAELICSVQPMTKHPLESVKVDFEPDDEVEKKKAKFIEKLEGASSDILASTKPIADAPAAVQGKPSLMETYVGMWPQGGSPITSISDLEMVFEDLVKATRHYIEATMGLTISNMDVCASTSISALHLEKQIVRAIKECVLPLVVVQMVMCPFDIDLLAAAVKRRACDKTDWNLSWVEFINKLHGVTVKCDEENNSPKDVEQGKLNVDVTLPPAEHVKLDFVIGPEGVVDNQPVPCDPPEPHKILAVTKVPYTDKHGAKVAQPAPGWWVGDDFCWHPPLSKDQEKYAFDLITALQPAALGQLPDPAEVKSFITPYLPLYTTPPIIPVDLQKKMGISVGGHGVIGPGGVVEDLKFDGAWPVTGPQPPITKVAPHSPSPADDVVKGFKIGNVWYNKQTGEVFGCVDNTVMAAKWNKVAQVTPTIEGPKVIATSKPQHIVDLEQHEIDDMKAKLGKTKLDDPVTATYVDTSDQPDFQKLFSPEAEQDLVHALAEEMKKEVDAAIVNGCYTSSGRANKNGDVFQKVPDSIAGMSDVVAMQEAFSKAMKIPKHLLGKVKDTK